MTPSLVKKYLEAARRVVRPRRAGADWHHLRPASVIAETDRDKFCVNRIIFFTEAKDGLRGLFEAGGDTNIARRSAPAGDIE